MTPLLLLQALDTQLNTLLPPLPGVEYRLDQCLANLFPGQNITARALHFGRWPLLDLIGLHLFDGATFTLPVATAPPMTLIRSSACRPTSPRGSAAFAQPFARPCMPIWQAIGWSATARD